MIKISGGYVAINPNIAISNITKKAKIGTEFDGVIAVLKNILLRGTPTKPSVFLKEILGDCKTGGYKYTLGTKKLDWSKTIKGGIRSTPALTFYNRLVEECEEAVCFLPECELTQIYYETENKNAECAVDFYSPFHLTTIEVDGPHHNEIIQGISDEQRDSLIKNRAGAYEPIRIKTSDFNSEDALVRKIRRIKQEITSRRTPKASFVPIESISEKHKLYMYVFRLQMLLLELFANGYIKMNDSEVSIEIKAESKDSSLVLRAFELAYSDLKMWFENLYTLLNKSIELPLITLKNNADFTVDIDIYNRYDGEFFNSDSVIRIRNDYFPYDRDAFVNSEATKDENDSLIPSKYCQSKNYYKVQTSDLRFNKVSADNETHKKALEFFLENIFGFNAFRQNQLEIIAKGLNPKKGVIGLLPTGSGKSLCYQFVSFLTPSITLIVSPLKLLMDDQKQNLFSRNLIMSAYQLHGDERGSITAFAESQTKMLYISPDRFFNIAFRKIIETKAVGQVVIDEVHCLSEWGHDFRTAYLLLFSFLKDSHLAKNVLLMGTSATASPNVIQDIKQEFERIKGQNNVETIKATSIRRPELEYSVECVENVKEKDNKVAELVTSNFERKFKTLIFCSYKANAYNIRQRLREENSQYNAQMYYSETLDKSRYPDANDSDEDKAEAFKTFANDKSLVLSATKAFGMGIDIPNIRHIIHYDIASSVESIYQEMGRAGRDGKNSYCTVILLDDVSSKEKIKELFERPALSIEELKKYQETSKDEWFNRYGAIGKQLRLLVNGNKDYGEWSDFIYNVYLFLCLDSRPENFEFLDFVEYYKKFANEETANYKELKGDFEKALYKLFVLGIIGLWNLSYANNSFVNPIYSNIVVNKHSSETLKDNLEKHILRFDRRYEYDPYESGYTVKDYITALCKWDNEKFLNYRWESLKTLYDMLNTFVDSETFANRIETFLKGSDKLDKLIVKSSLPQDWVDIFAETETSTLKDQLARYAAEYQNNATIEFLQGMIAIKSNEYIPEIMRKFKIVVSNVISQARDGGVKFVYEALLSLSDSQEGQERFLVFLADNYPQMLEQKKIQKHLEMFDETFVNGLADRPTYNAIYSSLGKLKQFLGDNV